MLSFIKRISTQRTQRFIEVDGCTIYQINQELHQLFRKNKANADIVIKLNGKIIKCWRYSDIKLYKDLVRSQSDNHVFNADTQ